VGKGRVSTCFDEGERGKTNLASAIRENLSAGKRGKGEQRPSVRGGEKKKKNRVLERNNSARRKKEKE